MKIVWHMISAGQVSYYSCYKTLLSMFITVVVIYGVSFQQTVVICGYITWNQNYRTHSHIYLSKIPDLFYDITMNLNDCKKGINSGELQ